MGSPPRPPASAIKNWAKRHTHTHHTDCTQTHTYFYRWSFPPLKHGRKQTHTWSENQFFLEGGSRNNSDFCLSGGPRAPQTRFARALRAETKNVAIRVCVCAFRTCFKGRNEKRCNPCACVCVCRLAPVLRAETRNAAICVWIARGGVPDSQNVTTFIQRACLQSATFWRPPNSTDFTGQVCFYA